MKIDVKQPILDYEGKKIFTNEAKTEFYDVRGAISACINYQEPNVPYTAEKKNKMFSIGVRLYKNSSVDLTLDDLSTIKELADKALAPLVYGRLMEVIDPQADPKLAE